MFQLDELSKDKDNKNTMQVYLVTDMTHVIALEAGQSSQGHLSLSHRSS